MKTIIIILLSLIVSISTNAQSFERRGNTFEQVTKTQQKSKYTETKYIYKDSKGKEYKINITESGRCFIFKVSAKTNKEYKYYLKEDISKAVCKELGIEYKEKK